MDTLVLSPALELSEATSPSLSGLDLPLWAQDIVDAQGHTDSESDSVASNPNLATRIQTVIDDPSRALSMLRDLYINRVRLGTNEELWDLMQATAVLLHAWPNHTDKDTASRVFTELFDAGLLELIELIVTDGDLFNDSTSWTYAVLDCLSPLAKLSVGVQERGVNEWEPDPEERAYTPPHMDDYVGRLSLLFDRVDVDAWESRDHWKVGGGIDSYPLEGSSMHSGAEVRSNLRDLLFTLNRFVERIKQPPHTDRGKALKCFRRLSILLWMFPDDDHINAEALFAILFTTFTGEPDPDFSDFVTTDMIAEYGAVPILERLRYSLNHPEIVPGGGAHLTIIQNAVQVFLSSDELWPYLSQTKIFPAFHLAMDYHLQRADIARKDSLSMVHFMVMFSQVFIQRTPFQQGAGVLIRESNIIEILGCFAIFSLGDATATHNLCIKSIDEWIKIAGALRVRSGKNAMRKKFKQSLRHEWYPTLRRLRYTRCRDENRRKKIVDAWWTLGYTMSLEEEKERADYEREMKRAAQFCAWKDCRFHTEKPEMPTRACAGCEEVRYCSKLCQQKDWKEGGHKLRCRRIKTG